MSLREVTIAELERDGCILAIQDGNHGEKHPKATDYVPEGVPFIMASDLRGGQVDLKGANKLPQEITDRLRIGFSRGGDVLLSHKGSVGYVAIAPEHSPYLMLTPQVTYYRVERKKISPEFLSYAFQDPLFQKRLASVAGQQGTRGYVGIRAQRQLKLRFAERPIQDRLVQTIKPYDDLIENNRRRIALLDGAARMLFREWFIRFRFPGHEHFRIIDGIPQGWKRERIEGLCCFLGRGISPRYDEEGEYVVINQKCIRDRLLSFGSSRRQSKEFKPKRGLQNLDVLINSTGTGTLGRVAQCWIVPENCTFDSHVTVARAKVDNDPLWFGYAMLELEPRFEEMGEGATNQKELSKTRIGDTKLVVPPKALRTEFSEFAADTTRQISVLSSQIDRLANARDLLLPRLMNGEIAV